MGKCQLYRKGWLGRNYATCIGRNADQAHPRHRPNPESTINSAAGILQLSAQSHYSGHVENIYYDSIGKNDLR